MSASPADRAAAREWLLHHADPEMTALLDAIREAYADGVVAGTGSASEAASVPVTGSLAALIPELGDGDVDWHKFWTDWKPGNPAAGALLADGGWSDLLAQAEISIKGVAGSTLDQMGTILADGVHAGESVDSIARAMNVVLGDRRRAQVIAHTEVARAVTVSTFQTYVDGGVGMWELVTSPDACDVCVEIADGGPYPVGDDGDAPPVHPNCECAASPVVAPVPA